jgi:hypothetical protein
LCSQELLGCDVGKKAKTSQRADWSLTKWVLAVRPISQVFSLRLMTISAETIQMLANMIDGRPPRDGQGPKTTLVVATPALANQWFHEIHKHCDQRYIGTVIQHHGKHGKLATNDNVATLCAFDVV